MGTDLSMYRAAIGLHYIRAYTSSQKIKHFVNISQLLNDLFTGALSDFALQIKCSSVILFLFTLQFFTGNALAVLYLRILLVLANDVHPHPGPRDRDNCTLSIFHLNIRSIRNKISYLSDIAGEHDIICITESHLDRNVNTSDLRIDGFHPDPFRKDRTAHGGGIMVYVSERLCVQRQAYLEDPTSETIWLKCIFKNYSFLLCCVYRPPNQDNHFWENFHNSIENAVSQNSHLVIIGDLNIDLLTVKNHQLIDIINSVILINVITTPTRHGPTRASLLDLILVKECSVSYSEVVDIDRNISDHDGVLVDIKINEFNSKKAYKRDIWLYRQADFQTFNNDIANIDWQIFLFNDHNDINIACDRFNSKYSELAQKNIPRKSVTIRPNDKPWFTSELRLEIRKRDRLRKKARSSNSLIVYENYRKQRNHVNNLKKATKQSFYLDVHGLIDQYSSNNSRDFWKLAKTLIKSTGTSTSIPPLINMANGNIAVDDKEKCDLLNNYFASISTIDEDDNDDPECDIRTDHILNVIDISEDDIIDIIKSLNINKVSGLD